ncbi:MAG: alpha/beta hydrolase [Micavibrio sp.]|nr:alpha/beta hydrolase [Micavibrio sp.]
MNETQYIDGPNGYKLAYVQINPDAPKTGIVFLGGFRSDMSGTKALFLEKLAKDQNLPFLRLDYGGHGLSGGVFEEGSIKSWHEDALFLIKKLTDRPQILIGSSMGGWISYLIAQTLPERIKALISLAPAPDFTDEFLENMSDEQHTMYKEKDFFTQPNDYSDEPYIFTKTLIEESRQCFLLDKGITYNGPVHILQGKLDSSVPWQKAKKIEDAFTSKNVIVSYVEDGDHSLSRPQDLALLKEAVLNTLNAEA